MVVIFTSFIKFLAHKEIKRSWNLVSPRRHPLLNRFFVQFHVSLLQGGPTLPKVNEEYEGFNKNTKVQFEKVYVLENVNIAVQDFKQKWQFVKFYFCLPSNQVVHQYMNFTRFFNFWKFTTFSKFTTFAPPPRHHVRLAGRITNIPKVVTLQ